MSLKEKLNDNIKAISLAFDIKKRGAKVGTDELEILSRYSGFGSLKCVLLDTTNPSQWPEGERNLIPLVNTLHLVLKENSESGDEYKEYLNSVKESTLTAFYTPIPIIKGIASVFKNNHLKINRLLDPSAGTGLFSIINSNQYIAFEKDKLTSLILSITNHDTYRMGFESIPENLKDFDIVASNIPFGNFSVFDKDFINSKDPVLVQSCKMIHTYFFAKGVEKLKDGGLLAFITSTGVMDSQSHHDFRKYLMSKTNLVSACRLPSGMFNDTEVMSDLIILQKDTLKKGISERELQFIETGFWMGSKELPLNSFYINNLGNSVGEQISVGTDPYGKKTVLFKTEKDLNELAIKLEKILNTDFNEYFSKKLYEQTSSSVKIKKTHKVETTGQLSLFDDFFSIKSDYFNYHNEIVAEPQTFQYNEIENLIGIAESGTLAKTASDLNEYSSNMIKGFIQIRDTYYNLCRFEKQGEQRDDLRQELNSYYDNFSNGFGSLYINAEILSTDTTFSELQGLENVSSNGKIEKADIFIHPIHFNLKIKDIKLSIDEALTLSLNSYNHVDLNFISEQTDMSLDDVKHALSDIIIFNPEDNIFQLNEMYLNGNLYKKLDICEGYLNSSGVEHKEDILKSIELIKEKIPEKIPFEDIGIVLGERWLPVEYLSRFAQKISNNPGVEWKYYEVSDSFECSHKYTNYLTEEKYRVSSCNRNYSAMDVLGFALIDNLPQMTITVKVGDKKTYIPDSKAIQLMNEKIQILKNEFSEFMMSLPLDDKNRLELLYNRKFNCFVKQDFNGSFQSFPELNREKLGISDLYDSQKNAVMMLKTQGGGIIDHEVGGGKTLIICCAAYEMKRLGIVNKPLIIGLKANIHEIAETYKNAYPESKLLYAGKKDFEKKSREHFLRKIQNNDWDCIIMTHEQFSEIPQSLDVEKDIIQEELDKIEDCLLTTSRNGGQISKKMEKGLLTRKINLENKLNMIIYNMENNRDNVVDFKTMGIDHIFVDECHKFKNLLFQTRHQRVSGLGNSDGSSRSLNLLFAIRTIQQKTGKDLGATFLSGTVISNSLTELYNVFNYLRPQVMKEQNIYSFDAWASVFCIKSRDFEFNVTNDIIQKERFRCFTKVPELAMFYSQITDYKTAKDIGVDRPEANEILVSLDQTPQQIDMYERLKQFAKNGDATLIYRQPLNDKEQMAKMLIATNTAKKASLDMRLIDEELFTDEKGNKLNAAANKIYDYYLKYNEQKGTQFVFSDLGTYKSGKAFNVYTELKLKLIEHGIPADEIQFIQTANTEKKRENLFKQMNNGTVRVLLGSTEMLGTGVNAQKRCIAIHHLDIPWTPKDLDQRNGRGVRKNNWVAKQFANNKVDIIIYGTKMTLDTYKLNLLKNKALFIAQVKTNTLSARTIDEGSMDQDSGMNFAEYIAVLSGNTDILKKTKLEKVITQLKSEEKMYYKQIHEKQVKIEHYNKRIAECESIISLYRKDYEYFKEVCPDKQHFNGFILNGEAQPDDPELFGKKLIEVYEKTSVGYHESPIIGHFYSFRIALRAETDNNLFNRSVKIVIESDNNTYSYNNGILAKTPKTAAQYVYNSLDKIPEYIVSYQKDISIYKEHISDLNKLEIKFINRQKLIDAQNELKEINNRLSSINGINEVRYEDKILYVNENILVDENNNYAIELPNNLLLNKQEEQSLLYLLKGEETMLVDNNNISIPYRLCFNENKYELIEVEMELNKTNDTYNDREI